jgi:hypothetical protein
MNIEVSDKYTPTGGFLMYNVDKTVDPRGFKERTGREIFAYIVGAALAGAHQRVSYDELKRVRKVTQVVSETANAPSSSPSGWVCNKTEVDLVRESIRNNRNWLNTDEMMMVLDAVIDRLDKAEVVE